MNVVATPHRWRLSRRARLFRRTRILAQTRGIALYAAVVCVGLLMGSSVVNDGRLAKDLVALAFLACLFAIEPEKLFVGWLFVAPLVQGASAGSHPGHAAFKALFLAPPLILVARAAMGAVELRRLWVIDVLPALYVFYILVGVKLLPSDFTGNESSLRAIYAAVGIGVAAYYFIAFGRTSDQFPLAVARALLWSGVVVAMLALVDAWTGWNLWHTTLVSGDQVRRAVSTFGSPAALGTYLGVGVAFAIAILVWNGPSSLRLPAILLIGLSIPALYFTYTRGPILAIAVVGVIMPLLANRARWPSLLIIAAVGILMFAAWNQISSSASYRERLGVTSTVTIRVELQHLSLELFRQKPLFGWGYNTFDQAKLTRDSSIAAFSSHDTFLTVLVELGVTGLILLVLPWAVISGRAIAAAWRGLADTWIVGASVGTVGVYVIGALGYDTRFFYISAAPWIAVGLARNVLLKGRTSIESA